MKRIIFALLFLPFSLTSKAQLAWQPAQTIDSLNNLWIYSVTCTGCWTHWHQGAVGDSIAQALNLLHSQISGADGLNATLTVGNIDTAQQIIGVNSGYTQTMTLDPNTGGGTFTFGNTSSNHSVLTLGNLESFTGGAALMYSLTNAGGYGVLTLRNGGYFVNLYGVSTLTATRNQMFSDQSGTVMLQTTNLPSVVNNASGYICNDGSGNTSISNGNQVSTQDGIGDEMFMSANGAGTNSFIGMSNSLGGRVRIYYSGVGSINQYWVRDKGGVVDSFAMVSDLIALQPIVGKQRVTGITNSAQALTAINVGASDTSFWVSSNVDITTSTLYSFQVFCTYTNESGVSTQTPLPFISPNTGSFIATGTIANTIGGAVSYGSSPIHIRCKAGTTITISSAGTFTGVVYNIEERINKE